MASRDNQGQAWKRDFPGFEENRLDMSFKMVYANQWLFKIVGKPLGKREPHQQRTDQTRPLGHSINIDLLQLKPGAIQALLEDISDRDHVLA